MDYEKAYKDALERARVFNDGGKTDIDEGTTLCEYIFPELKESEDERIRDILFCIVRDFKGIGKVLNANCLTVERVLAWLNKHGGQKHAEWSEEDEENLNWVINIWDTFRRGGNVQTSPGQMVVLEDWLKSLREKIWR